MFQPWTRKHELVRLERQDQELPNAPENAAACSTVALGKKGKFKRLHALALEVRAAVLVEVR